MLARAEAGRHAKSFMLIGLRGVGKTVLLNRIFRMAQDRRFRALLVEAHEDKPLPELLLPPLRQILLGLDRPAADVAASLRRHGGNLLEAVELFDVYRGRPLEATDKSLAWRLRFQAPDRTLTEAEIDAAIEAIHVGLAADVGGRIRG